MSPAWTSCEESKQLMKSMELFVVMQLLGLEPDVVTYNAAIGTLRLQAFG